MGSHQDGAGPGAEVRQRAEQVARKSAPLSPEDIEALSPHPIRQALHELRAYQIELEMQNEELRRARAEIAAAKDRYFDLYDAAPVGVLQAQRYGAHPGGQSHRRQPAGQGQGCTEQATDLPIRPQGRPGHLPGPAVKANASQIQQILTHLITNAWEAHDGHGAVSLAVGTVALTDIPVSHASLPGTQTDDTPCACLEVRDTGCGISEQDKEKLFDPFFSTKFAGRGLGLSVAHGIVKAHGGAISVDSDPGRGSLFRVYLPCTSEEVARRPETPAQAADARWRGTVLLVEDDETLLTVAVAMVTRLGFKVIEAKDGVEAVELFRPRRDEICVVLCDLTMPRMNGWETLAALRGIRSDIRVVLASGYEEADVMAGDHPEWPQAFLAKPYARASLRDALAKASAE